MGQARRAVRLAALGAGTLLLAAARARAGVILTERAALERAFPGQSPERRTLYLTEQQAAAVQKAARSKLPSPVVTVCRCPLRARTAPAISMAPP